MAIVAPILGGTTLANCRDCTQSEIFVGLQEHAHDGTLLTDYTALKNGWEISWTVRSEGERDTIRGRYDVVGTQSFTAPDGGTATVVVRRGSWSQSHHLLIADGDPRYDVRFSVEEYQ